MLKTLAVSTLLLGSTIAFAQPAAARDRDDNRNNNNRDRDHYAASYSRDRRVDQMRDRDDRNRDRDDWYGRDNRRGRDERFVPNARTYSNGYYDRFGNWCAY